MTAAQFFEQCNTPTFDLVVTWAGYVSEFLWLALFARNIPSMYRMAFYTPRNADFMRFAVFMLTLSRLGYAAKRILFGKPVSQMCMSEEFMWFWLILLSIAGALIAEAVCQRQERKDAEREFGVCS